MLLDFFPRYPRNQVSLSLSRVQTVKISCFDCYLLGANTLSVQVLILEKTVAQGGFPHSF